MNRARLTLRVPPPFELRLALFGHGFIDLCPNGWTEATGRFTTVIPIGDLACDVEVAQDRDALRATVSCERALSRAELARVRGALSRMLRLQDDLSPLWRLCRADPERAWVARRGAGRLLRSPTVFEDLAKLLLTTNCSWAATRGMVRRLTESLGTAGPGGKPAFPAAQVCAAQDPEFFRQTVRAGYRATALHAIAVGFAEGRYTDAFFEAPDASTEVVRDRLLALPGFGPYAAGQALRLLGRYSEFALDSWCRARLAQRFPRSKHDEQALGRRYRRYGDYRGLVLWLDLTARWHGEGPEAASKDTLLNAATAE